MTPRYTYLLLLLALFLQSCVLSRSSKYDLLLVGANVVDVEQGTVLQNQTIAVQNGVIQKIADAGTMGNAHATARIDATGKYLIPGLWDSHIHLRGPGLEQENKNLLPLFIAHGVTSVRDAGGDLYPAIRKWRTEIEAGDVVGPNILSSGPKLDGPKATWEGSIAVATPAEVPAAMDSLQKLGVDFVKIYDSTISGEVFLSIVKEAEARGLKVTGHMPFTITLEQTMALGLDATEHLYYILKAASAKEDSITAAINASMKTKKPIGFWAALRPLYDTYDPATAQRTFNRMAETNTAVVPTLHISRVLNNLHQDDHQQDTLLAYIGEGIVKTYERRISGARNQSAEMRAFLKSMNARTNAMVPQMQAAGVTILAGSDCGAFNSYVYPGISLHKELEELVASGLTPAEALRAGTINGARFMNRDVRYGTVALGKIADLVLLDQNPLENISHTQQIHTVIKNGKVYSQKDLEQMLESVRVR